MASSIGDVMRFGNIQNKIADGITLAIGLFIGNELLKVALNKMGAQPSTSTY